MHLSQKLIFFSRERGLSIVPSVLPHTWSIISSGTSFCKLYTHFYSDFFSPASISKLS